jgi:uncharacterized protein
MGLKQQLSDDLVVAMKARDERRVSAIRMLRAAIGNLEIARTDRKNPQHGQDVTETDLLALVQKDANQRREALQFAQQAGRTELMEKEQAELAVVEGYLPRLLSRDEIVAEVEPLVTAHGRDFRAVMPIAARQLRGRADGRLVSEVVRELTG